MRELVEEHRGALLAVARRFCRDEGEADELVHRTILHVLEHPDALRHEENPRGWLATVMARQHSGAARTPERRRPHVPIEEVQIAAPEAPGMEDEPDWKSITLEELSAAIEKLPLKLRMAWTMFACDEMKQQEIAQALGVSHTAVRARVHRARKKLIQILNKMRKRK